MVFAVFFYFKDQGVAIKLTYLRYDRVNIHKFDDLVPGFNEFLSALTNGEDKSFKLMNSYIYLLPDIRVKLPDNYRQWLEELWDFEAYASGRWNTRDPEENAGVSDDEGIEDHIVTF